ncbi:MAG: universal stress protein [Gemmatimonadota bacterium]
MFRRILVSMDLSPATEALVAALPGLKELGTREIILAHVARPVQEPVSHSLRQVEDIRARLTSLAERLREDGFQVTVEVPSGSPAAELVRLAEAREPDAIMVGSRSHARVYEAFVGSVAWEIVRRARRPVILHRIEASRPDPEAALQSRGSGRPARVIYPTDFSTIAAGALPWLSNLAREGVEGFTLLHVLPVGSMEGREDAQASLDALADELRSAGAKDVRVEIRPGTPHEEVLAMGGRNPDNWVVMGTHGRGFLPEIVMGSESRQVVRQASATVLLIPAEEGNDSA